jgi:hypothetical protein
MTSQRQHSAALRDLRARPPAVEILPLAAKAGRQDLQREPAAAPAACGFERYPTALRKRAAPSRGLKRSEPSTRFRSARALAGARLPITTST